MSFSRLLQNAPFYSPAAFSPSRRQQRQDGSSPSASSSSLPAFDRRRRTKASRPLVDPYAALPAPEFDNFVDDVSSRIVNALTYEPNRDRRVRRGYADDDEYWMEMGGKPGEFVGNLTQDLESEHVEETLQDAQAEPEDEEERSQEDQAIDAETGREVPAQQELNSERHLYDDEPSAIP